MYRRTGGAWRRIGRGKNRFTDESVGLVGESKAGLGGSYRRLVALVAAERTRSSPEGAGSMGHTPGGPPVSSCNAGRQSRKRTMQRHEVRNPRSTTARITRALPDCGQWMHIIVYKVFAAQIA